MIAAACGYSKGGKALSLAPPTHIVGVMGLLRWSSYYYILTVNATTLLCLNESRSVKQGSISLYVYVYMYMGGIMNIHFLSTHVCIRMPYFAVIRHTPPAMRAIITPTVHCHPTPTASTNGIVAPLAAAEKAY